MTNEILVVDDQPGIRLLLHDILTKEGYSITTVSTGLEALEKLQKQPFDLILLDYNIPQLNGLGVLEKMDKMNLDIPTIVMSGLVEQFEYELERFLHVKKIIAKPFNIALIPLLVKQVLSQCSDAGNNNC